MAEDTIEKLLVPTFPKKHVVALVRHYKLMSDEFLKRQWEDCIAKAGKFNAVP